jgi:hypothetical protein
MLTCSPGLTGRDNLSAVAPYLLFICMPAVTAWIVLACAGNHQSLPALCLAPRPVGPNYIFEFLYQAISSAADLLTSTALMTCAMALPLALLPAMRVTATSLEDARVLQCVIFLAAYGTTWFVLMATLTMAVVILQGFSSPGSPIVPWGAISLLLVAAHRLTPEARRALIRCHRVHPVRVFAPLAQLDVSKLGVITAVRCARLCWPFMLLPWIVSRPLFIMFFSTALSIAERHSFHPNRPAICLVLLVLAGVEWLIPAL